MRATLKRLSASRRTHLTILVAALGYFVDVFDIQLFSIVRVKSLQSFGLSPEQITSYGAVLLDSQMAGMLLGGLVWGALGDRRGRIQVLFGTILLYSIGNIANAFVTSVPAYAVARFVAGFGLAGEIGAGITLASELIPRHNRGYATVLIAVCGTMGPVAGSLIANAVDWRMAYVGGGVMGLLLLMLRVSVHESGMFAALKKQTIIKRGRFRMLFNNPKRFGLYLGCIFLAVPIWFTLGVIVFFSPELGLALGIKEPVTAASSMMSYFIGLTLGGICCGLLSQMYGNRKKVTGLFIFGAGASVMAILHSHGISSAGFYAIMVLVSFFCGYWGLFLTIAAEMFGTNLRTLVVSTVSNFVRASTIITTSAVAFLKPEFGLVHSILIVGIACFVFAFIAIWRLPETYARDLDFVEH